MQHVFEENMMTHVKIGGQNYCKFTDKLMGAKGIIRTNDIQNKAGKKGHGYPCGEFIY